MDGETDSAARVRGFVRVFAASLCAHLGAFLFLELSPYLKGLGASEATIGTAAAVNGVAAIVVRPLVGPLMDRRGRRPILLAGGLLHTLASAAYVTVTAADGWLLAVRAVQGVSFGLFFSAVFTVAADLAEPAKRTQRMAQFGISGILPMAIGAVLGRALVGAVGHTGLFSVATVFAGLGLVLAATVPETATLPRPGEATHAPDGGLLPAGSEVVRALTDPSLRPLWVAGAFFSAGVASYFVFVRNFAEAEALGSVDAFFVPYAAIAIVVRLVFGHVPAQVGETRVFPLALTALGAGVLALALARGPASLAVAGTLCGLGHAFSFPVLLALFVSRAAAAIRGTVVTLFTALLDVGVSAASPVYGALADHLGYRSVFFAATAVCLLTAAWSARTLRPLADAHEPG